MTAPTPLRLQAVLAVTIDTEGDYYVDHADLIAHVVPWIDGTLDDRDDIRNVTITEQAAGDRGAILREAIDALEEAVNQMRREDKSREPYRANSLGAGMVHAIGRLRRMADEAQQPEAQAHPPRHRWYVEVPDGDEWMLSSSIATDRAATLERLDALESRTPRWKDGDPVQRRLVRETTTHTVETAAAESEVSR